VPCAASSKSRINFLPASPGGRGVFQGGATPSRINVVTSRWRYSSRPSFSRRHKAVGLSHMAGERRR
jgi:hypothetical protein